MRRIATYANALLHHQPYELFTAVIRHHQQSIQSYNSRFLYSSTFRLKSNEHDATDFFEGLYFEGEIPKDRIKQKWTNASGPGGMNVNKNPTKAEIRFNLKHADWIPPRVRERLRAKFPAFLNSKHEFAIISQKTRFALDNMEDCYTKLHSMLLDCSEELVKEARREQIDPEYLKGLEERKERSEQFRLAEKKRQSEKRRSRRNNYI